jgi:hypothetical protein
MSCCCTKIYKFCKPVNGCNSESFAALFASVPDGSYIIQLDFLGSVQIIGITITGGVLDFTSSIGLNENFTYTGQLLNGSGVVVPLYFSTVAYDCFQFTTAGFTAQSGDAPPSLQYIQDVIAGSGVSIDKTDPKRPVISATGGTSGVAKSYVDNADQTLQSNIDSKVDKISGKSLIDESEIIRLASVTNQDLSVKVDKVTGSGLISDIEKTRLSAIPSDAQKNDPNTTLEGNSFNGISQLVKLNSTGDLMLKNVIASGIDAFSGNPKIVIAQTVSTPGSTFTTNNQAYAAFDARGFMTGANFDHYAGFQSAPTINMTGNLTNLYGVFSLPTIEAGVVENNYAFYLTRANVVGGSITNDYGLYINGPIAGTANNFAIYTYGIAPSSFGGLMIANKGLIAGDNPTIGGYVPSKQLEARSQSDLESALRISQAGYNNWDIKSPASSTSLVIGDVSGNYLAILNGGKFGFNTLTPTAQVHIESGQSGAGKAPLKLNAGPLMTTPENGAIEYDGTNLYFTTGGVRKTVTLT